MGGALILETTFLIDLEREHNRGTPGPAVAFLVGHADQRLYLPFVVAGELGAGPSLRDRDRWERVLGPVVVLESSPDGCGQYGGA